MYPLFEVASSARPITLSASVDVGQKITTAARVVAFNVRAGGAARCRAIVDSVLAYDADVVVLAETTQFRASDLCHQLRDSGYPVVASSARQTATTRGVCLLSKVPFERRPAPEPVASLATGWIEIFLPLLDLQVSAVYGPADAPAIRSFWKAMAEWAPRAAECRRLVIGDLNVGADFVDAAEVRFTGGRHFARFLEAGFVDAWRTKNPSSTDATWYSRGARGVLRRGFRIDHALVSSTAAHEVAACLYSHREREQGISDHSLLVLDVAREAR